MATFTAQWGGPAACCPAGIVGGDEVTYDGANGLIHVECPLDREVKTGAICPSCFVAMPLTGSCPDCE